jgi:hypothetical protein
MLQIWTRDMTPELVSESGRALGSGIASFGHSVGNGLAQLAERHQKQLDEDKQFNQQGKAAESFFKASPELQQSLGMSPEAFGNLAARDKVGAVAGALGAQHFAEGYRKGKSEDFALSNEKLAPKFMGRFGQLAEGQYDAPPAGQEGPPNQTVAPIAPFAAFGQASRETGYVPPPAVLAHGLNLFADKAKANGQDFLPQEYNISGRQGIVSPKTGMLIPDQKPGQLSYENRLDLLDRRGLHEEKRALIGAQSRSFDPAEKATYGAQISAIEQRLAKPPTKEDLANYDLYIKQLQEERKLAEANNARINPAPGAAPAAGSALAMPKTRAELQAGQQYQTGRGVATWDGTKFVQ